MKRIVVSLVFPYVLVCAAVATDERADNVLSFNHAQARMATAANLWPGLTADLTLTAWVKPDRLPTSGERFFAVAGRGWLENTTGFGLYLDNVGDATFQTREGDSIVTVSAPFPSDGAWHHLAGVRDGNVTRLYIDGAEVAQDSGALGSLFNAVAPFSVGMRQSNLGVWAYPYVGAVAEVQLWDHARAPADISSDMFQCLSGTETGLLGYWPLNEGMGTVAADNTAAGNDGTLLNTMWHHDFLFGASLALPGAGWLGWWPLTLADPETGDPVSTTNTSVNLALPTLLPGGYDAAQIAPSANKLNPSGWVIPSALPAQAAIPSNLNRAWVYAWYTNTVSGGPLRRSAGAIRFFSAASPAVTFASVSGGRVEMPANLWPGLTNLTLQAWVKTGTLPASGSYYAIAGRGYLSATNGFGLYLNPSGTATFQARTGNTVGQLDYPFPPDGVWYNLTGVWDGTAKEMRLYLDGEPVAQNSITLTSLDSVGLAFAIGQVYRTSGTVGWQFPFLGGAVAEVRLWDYARTATEVKEDLHYRLSGDEPGLIGYWPLDDATGTTARDLSPTPHSGVFIGNVDWENTFDGILLRPPPPPPRGTIIMLR